MNLDGILVFLLILIFILGYCCRRLFRLCESLVNVGAQRFDDNGILYPHQCHALAWLRHRERRRHGEWLMRQCLPTRLLQNKRLIYKNTSINNESNELLDSKLFSLDPTFYNSNDDIEEDFQMLWITDLPDPLRFMSLWNELRLISITDSSVVRCFKRLKKQSCCRMNDDIFNISDRVASMRTPALFPFFDSLYRFLVVEGKVLYALTVSPSTVVFFDEQTKDSESCIHSNHFVGQIPAEQCRINLNDFLQKSEFSLFINRPENEITFGFSSLSSRRKAIERYGGGFFCDEPGLGKTLSILSLIMKDDSEDSSNEIKRDNEDKEKIDMGLGTSSRSRDITKLKSSPSISKDLVEFFTEVVHSRPVMENPKLHFKQVRMDPVSAKDFTADLMISSSSLSFEPLKKRRRINHKDVSTPNGIHDARNKATSSSPEASHPMDHVNSPESIIGPYATSMGFHVPNSPSPSIQSPRCSRFRKRRHFGFLFPSTISPSLIHSPFLFPIRLCNPGVSAVSVTSRCDDFRPFLPLPKEASRLVQLSADGDVLDERILRKVEDRWQAKSPHDSSEREIQRSDERIIVNEKNKNVSSKQTQRKRNLNLNDHEILSSKKYMRVIQQLGADTSWKCFNFQNSALESHLNAEERKSRRSFELAEILTEQTYFSNKTESSLTSSDDDVNRTSFPNSERVSNAAGHSEIYANIISHVECIPECIKGSGTLIVTPNNLVRITELRFYLQCLK